MAYTLDQLQSLARMGSFVNDPRTGQQISAQQYADLMGMGRLPAVDQSLANGRPIQETPFDYVNGQTWAYRAPTQQIGSLPQPIGQPGVPMDPTGAKSAVSRTSVPSYGANNQLYIDMSQGSDGGWSAMPQGMSSAPVTRVPNTRGGISYDEFDIPEIGDITLGDTPMISNTFSPEFAQQYGDFARGRAQDIGNYYNFTTPQMQAAQIGRAPQAALSTPEAMQMYQAATPGAVNPIQARTPEGFEALDFLLQGQGFDDATMSKMRGRAMDDSAQALASRLSRGKIAAQQAGLGPGSGAALALQDQAAKEGLAAQQRALYDLDIQNAMTGMENRRLGSQMELGRRTDAANMGNQVGMFNNQLEQGRLTNAANMQNQVGLANQQMEMNRRTDAASMANANALANAGMMLQTMSQNAQMQQQANQVNNQNQMGQQMQRASDQSQFTSSMGQNYGNAMTQRNIGADQQNAANQINQNNNQAQLDRQRDMFNVGTGENRYGMGLNAHMQLIGNSNPSGYAQSGAQLGSNYQPNMTGANALQNVGNGLTTVGIRELEDR